MTLMDTHFGTRYVAPREPIDAEVFRSAMGQVCTPVTVVTAFDDGRPHGTTVSAFASQSLDPPMVLVSLATSSRLLPVLTLGGRFAVNVLGTDQGAAALHFASKSEDKFDGQTWDERHGAPCLPGSATVLVCEAAEQFVAGDHVIVCGTVVHAESSTALPLTYHDRTFGTHAAATT